MDTDAGSRQKQLIEFLRSLGIIVNPIAYPAHSTVEEGRALRGDMAGTFTKNLLLRVDLGTLHAKIGASGRLGFASLNTVREILAVEPGALTPLALMFDGNRKATVVLDESLMREKQLNFHPLVNTQSVGLSPAELIRFIDATNHAYILVDLAA
jgi:Ala-tRNA(Pro) deacylase